MSEYKEITKKFKRKGHFWIATNEACKCGDDFVVLRRVGYETQLKNLPPGQMISPKICVLKTEIQDKLL